MENNGDVASTSSDSHSFKKYTVCLQKKWSYTGHKANLNSFHKVQNHTAYILVYKTISLKLASDM